MRVLDLQTLFIKAAGEDGILTRQEWLKTLSSPEICPLLTHLDLPREVAIELFDVLDTDATPMCKTNLLKYEHA